MPTPLPTVQESNQKWESTIPDANMPGSPGLNNAEIFGVKAAGSGTAAPSPATTTRTAPVARVNPDTITTTPTPAAEVGTPGLNGKAFNAPIAPGTFTPNGPDRATDLNSYAQALTDQINAKYTAKEGSDKDYIASQDARVRVLNTRAGLTDSGTGAAAVDTVQKKGNAVIAADEAAKNAEIGVALGKVDELRANQARADAAQKQQDLKNYNDLRVQNQKDAQDSLSALAKNGTDLDTLKTKEPQTYATLQKELGLSDLEMTAKYNSYATNATKFQYKISGDTVTAYGVDGKGKLVVQDEKVPGLSSGNWKIQETKDGSLYKVNTSTGEITTLHGGSKSGASSTSYEKNQETDAKNWLALQPGFDSAVDSEKFDSDPTFRAWAIEQAAAAKPKKGSSGGSNPFSS